MIARRGYCAVSEAEQAELLRELAESWCPGDPLPEALRVSFDQYVGPMFWVIEEEEEEDLDSKEMSWYADDTHEAGPWEGLS